MGGTLEEDPQTPTRFLVLLGWVWFGRGMQAPVSSDAPYLIRRLHIAIVMGS